MTFDGLPGCMCKDPNLSNAISKAYQELDLGIKLPKCQVLIVLNLVCLKIVFLTKENKWRFKENHKNPAN